MFHSVLFSGTADGIFPSVSALDSWMITAKLIPWPWAARMKPEFADTVTTFSKIKQFLVLQKIFQFKIY